MTSPFTALRVWLNHIGNSKDAATALIVAVPLRLGHDLDCASLARFFGGRITFLGQAFTLVLDDGGATVFAVLATNKSIRNPAFITYY